MATKFNLGFYGSNPDAYDAAVNAQFTTSYDEYVALMGTRPVTMNGFVDYSEDPSLWASNAQFTALSWAQTGANYVGPTSGTTPVIGVPMSSNAGGFSNIDTFLKAIVNGTYDADYKAIVDAWADQGYKTLDLRIGYEFNGNFMPWAPGNSASATIVADFVAAWQHLANLVHAEGQADGITVNTIWNPATVAWTNQDVTTLYPGNQYVDIIGTDIYSPVYAPANVNWSATNPAQLSGTSSTNSTTWAASVANRDHYWTYSNANQWNPTGQKYTGWSIQQAIELAQVTGKPLAIAETGAGGNGTTTGPVDDASFPAWLAAELSQPGAPQIAFVNIWATDQSDGNWGFLTGQKPAEAAAWATYFGANSSSVANGSTVAAAPIYLPSGTAATIVGSGSDKLTLQMSEDAYQGDAQFVVLVNGVQVGGVQTVTAINGTSQQTFVFEGNWGSGAQKVTVDFLNDAWGGTGLDRNLYVASESYDGIDTAFPLGLFNTGSQSVTVGVAGLPQVTFTDDKNSALTQAVIASGSLATYQGHLDGNVFQWVSNGVNWITTSNFATMVLQAAVTDGTGLSYDLANFETVSLGLSGATAGTLAVTQVAGGNIRLSGGNYNANIAVQANSASGVAAAINTFNVSLGSGTDNFVLNASNGYGKTIVNVLSTLGTHTMNFIYPGSLNFVEDNATDTISVTGGTNSFYAGKGTLTINENGGGGTNAYYFGSGDNYMTISGFTAAHGDTIWLDSRLQAGLIVQSDGHSGTVLNFTVNTVGIDLKNVTSFNQSAIHWYTATA